MCGRREPGGDKEDGEKVPGNGAWSRKAGRSWHTRVCCGAGVAVEENGGTQAQLHEDKAQQRTPTPVTASTGQESGRDADVGQKNPPKKTVNK